MERLFNTYLKASMFSFMVLPCIGGKSFNIFINQEFYLPFTFFFISSFLFFFMFIIAPQFFKFRIVNLWPLCFLIALDLLIIFNASYHKIMDINERHIVILTYIILFFFFLSNFTRKLLMTDALSVINLTLLCNIIVVFYWNIKDGQSYIGNFNNSNTLSLYLTFYFPFLIQGLKAGKRHLTIFSVINLSPLGFLLISNGARAAIIILLIFLYIMFAKSLVQIGFKSATIKIFICLLIAMVFLFKRDSSSGRLLVAKISAGSIMSMPLFGHGVNTFSKFYNERQAQYFRSHSNRKEERLAGKIKYGYNEFLQLGIEMGFPIVLIMVLILGLYINLTRLHQVPFFAYVIVYYFVSSLFYFPFHSIYLGTLWLIPFYFTNSRGSQTILFRIHNVFAISVVFIFLFYRAIPIFYQAKNLLQWKNYVDCTNVQEKKAAYSAMERYLSANEYFLQNAGVFYFSIGEFGRSNEILKKLLHITNNNEIQNLMGDNYVALDSIKQAISCYALSANMVPNRFIPKYKLLVLYNYTQDHALGKILAEKILDQEVKIRSPTTDSIKSFANNYLLTLTK